MKIGHLILAIAGVLALVLIVCALASPAQADEPQFDARGTVVEFWQSKGVPLHVAEGIADQTQKESGGNPFDLGDGGTSLGLYQHHAERMMAVLAAVENDQAFREVLGEDPIAARHWAEIRSAPDRKTAAKLWQTYFERPARQRVADPAAARRTDPPPAQPHQVAGSANQDVTLPEVIVSASLMLDPFLEPFPAPAELTFNVRR